MMIKSILLAGVLLFFTAANSYAQTITYPVTYKIADKLQTNSGGTFSLTAVFKVDAPWYIYAPTGSNAAQGMIETNIIFTLPEGISREGNIQLPKSHFKGAFEVYEGDSSTMTQGFQVAKDLPAGEYTIHAKISYQSCNERMCLPPKTDNMDIKVVVKAEPFKLQFTALDGRKVDLAALKGKLVLIDCWATWCRPCIAEFANLKKLYDKYHKQGFEVIGVSADVSSAKPRVLQLVKEHALPWPQRFEGAGFDKDAFLQANGVKALPTVFLIDKNGKIVGRDARGEKLEGLIQTYLK